MSSKFCTRCGASVGSGRFCTSCGAATAGAKSLAEDAHSQPDANGHTNGEAASESAGVATAVRVEAPRAAPPAQGQPPSQPAPPPRRSRRVLQCAAVVVAALLAIGAVVLLAVGGEPANHARNVQAQSTRLTDALLATRQLYVPTQQSSFLDAPAGGVASGEPVQSQSDRCDHSPEPGGRWPRRSRSAGCATRPRH